MAGGRRRGDGNRKRKRLRAEERAALVAHSVAVVEGIDGGRARERVEEPWPEIPEVDRRRIVGAVTDRLTLRRNLEGARDQLLLLSRVSEAIDVLIEVLPQLRTKDPADPHQAALSRRRAALLGALGMEPCLSDREPPIPPGPIDALYFAAVNARAVIPRDNIDKASADLRTAELAYEATGASLDEISLALGRSRSWASERRHARKSR